MKRVNLAPSPLAGFVAAGLCLVLLFGGCAATEQTGKPQITGFLGDYSQLREGEKGEALLVYLETRSLVVGTWKRYDQMLIDPITIWYRETASGIPAEEAQQLADHLDAALRQQLAKDYTLVDQPGSGVLRLRVAITEMKGAKKALNVTSSVLPPMRLMSAVKKVTTGTHAFVGRAGIEAEILDSMTGERLAAAVDHRVGTKRIKGSASTWGQVQAAFDYWAERLRIRLEELRQK